MNITTCAVSAFAMAAVSAGAAQARDQVQIAGSSTVLPYASIVAEAFGENFDFPTPVVESGGSSAGLKRFCEGVGETTIDIADSSRKIRDGEREVCAANGVTDIVEVRIGYDGIVFASQQGGPAFDAFTPSQWYTALAAEIPGEDGVMAANANETWAQIDATLPDAPILAFIPGTKHGTREVFEEKVILKGCEDTGAMERMMTAGMSEDDAETACMDLRTDGSSVDIDGDYTETLARISSRRERRGRVRSVLLREQHRQAEGRDDGRRDAVDRDDLDRRVSGVPASLLLRQEGAYRRHPGAQGIRGVLRLRRHFRGGRALVRLRPDARPGACRDAGGRRRRDGDGLNRTHVRAGGARSRPTT